MGGIATWCMHYVGNRAIVLKNGKQESQINYSKGLAILSFFLPVTMEFVALGIIGSNERLSVGKVIMSSVLSSDGLVCMHYLAQASISNYKCSYNVSWIIGAVILSFLACLAGLAEFFLIYASWNTSWWKRALCAIIISSAISAVHWLSSIGTFYHAQKVDTNPTPFYSSFAVIIIIITLVGYCIASLFSCTN